MKSSRGRPWYSFVGRTIAPGVLNSVFSFALFCAINRALIASQEQISGLGVKNRNDAGKPRRHSPHMRGQFQTPPAPIIRTNNLRGIAALRTL
jgi:hypothetical protein